jgi:ATP-dependent Clp protease ATP-binding subunit ClpX
MSLENVQLEFEDEAIQAIAEKAIDKETGARGLRAILEELMLDVMYDVPSRKDVRKCVITDGVVREQEEPLLVYENEIEDEDEDESPSSALA